MSGFLQRLASGVLHEQRAIHPAVGTIWSAPGITGPGMMEWPGMAEPIQSSEDVRLPPSPRRADAPASPATQQFTQQPATPQMQPERIAPVSDSAVRGDAEQPAIAEAITFQPLVASTQRRTVSTLPPAPHANETTEQSEAIPPPRHPVISPENSPHQMYGIESTQPLVPALRIAVPAMVGAHKAPSFLPPSQRHAQLAQSVVEEPNSVEIHIGRIEVLAAPSRPAQTPAPRSARKSLDLGEYLRRERRSR
jgi:hypothetical protein